MTVRRLLWPLGTILIGLLLPTVGWADEVASEPAHDFALAGTWVGLLSIAIFIVAYLLVMLEEITDLRKSIPVIIGAAVIWMLSAGYVHIVGISAPVDEVLAETLVEFAALFLFLLVAMTYVNAMIDRNVFGALRSRLTARGFSYRQLFWITGFLAFFLSPAIDNLTTALVLSAVVLAVAQGNKRFISLGCINIVVAANAGGAFSPFGDITTLMVWQAHKLTFFEFFALFLPALVNFVVPAAIMHWAIPHGKPMADDALEGVYRGGFAVIIAFAATIATAVLGHSFLGVPPYLGMMLGLAYLQCLMYYLMKTAARKEPLSHNQPSDGMPPDLLLEEGRRDPEQKYNVFEHIARAEWDTLLFFFGVLLCVGGLGFLGYLTMMSELFYGQLGATVANISIGVISAIIDNIPIMAAVIQMNPPMSDGEWLLITLTAGVGGSLLSIGSAAGVALMGQARGAYTFLSHLKWTWAIALGYAASIAVHLWINGSLFSVW